MRRMDHLCLVFCLSRDFLAPKATEKGDLKISIIMDNFCILCIRKSFLCNSRFIVAKCRIFFIFCFHLMLSNVAIFFIIHTNLFPFVCMLLSSLLNNGLTEVDILANCRYSIALIWSHCIVILPYS